jgi:hypothetical protein
MSIFGKIVSAIFGGAAQAAPASAPPAGGASDAGPASSIPAGVPPPSPTQLSSIDLTAHLDKLADDHDEDLDWRKSIVDLMKLLDMDSSLANRRELAAELAYTGSTKDTATMNVWLHKQVMAKLAANGGNVPAELLG